MEESGQVVSPPVIIHMIFQITAEHSIKSMVCFNSGTTSGGPVTEVY